MPRSKTNNCFESVSSKVASNFLHLAKKKKKKKQSTPLFECYSFMITIIYNAYFNNGLKSDRVVFDNEILR